MVELSSILNCVKVKILFDSSATDALKQVEMDYGEKQAVSPSVEKCFKDLEMCTTRLEVCVIALGTYDVIIGTDWL